MSHCDDILRAAGRLDVDESEAVHSQKRITTVRITNSEIAEVKEAVSCGAAARLIRGRRILSVRAPGPAELARSIEDGRQVMERLTPKGFWMSLHQESPRACKVDRTYDPRLEGMSGTGAADIAQAMINEAADGRVGSVSGSLNIVSDKFQIANSHGLEFEDSSTFISGVINADAGGGLGPASGIGQGCCRTLGGFDASGIGRDARDMCVGSVNPARTESGRYSVIFEPYSAGEIMAFVLAANFHIRTVREGRSCLSGTQGRAVAPEILNITDDPFVPDAVGSKSVDDEGGAAGKMHLIKDGVFTDTFSDLYDACRFGTGSSGNASRPGSPMGTGAEPDTVALPHNVRVEEHTCKRDGMLKDVRRGIVVGRIWYTYALNPIRGDFSCTARSGIQIVENGEIVGPGRPVRIVDNLRRLLENTADIADDARNVQQWDSVPSIVPTMRFDGVDVAAV